MKNINACLSHKSDDWETPIDLFKKLDDEFHFVLDPCCTSDNHLCLYYFTKEDDGLSQCWDFGGSVFVNPPYSNVSEWVYYSYLMWKCHNINIVLLIPSRTDTRWFHDVILPYCEIRFVKGRLKFSNSKNSAPFPSMICIFRKKFIKSS